MTDTILPAAILIGILVLTLGVLRLRHVSIAGLMFGLAGAIIGLLLGALASVPLSKLPGAFGGLLPITVTGILTVVMIVVMAMRRDAIVAALPFLAGRHHDGHEHKPSSSPAGESSLPPILVDTSVIIDGRIADIARAGFVPGRLVVPRFVLAELQNIADSEDAMRRGRGRRGLDVLNTLRELPDVEVSIIEDDVQGVREVDAKLVALAQKFSCNVLTTDYNLNRVAQIQGVRVLNVNELSNAIRPVVLPGEELVVRVVQPGKERNQGVGYLADGTMIVVENGDKLIGRDVATEVTRVFQTVAGKMIFAVPRQDIAKIMQTPAPAAPAMPEPAPAEQVSEAVANPADSDNSGRRGRGNRGRGGAKRQSARPGSSSGSIEDRIISANQPDQPSHLGKPNHTGKSGRQRHR